MCVRQPSALPTWHWTLPFPWKPPWIPHVIELQAAFDTPYRAMGMAGCWLSQSQPIPAGWMERNAALEWSVQLLSTPGHDSPCVCLWSRHRLAAAVAGSALQMPDPDPLGSAPAMLGNGGSISGSSSLSVFKRPVGQCL